MGKEVIDKPAQYYLSGPMSGIPKFNFPLFRSATADLRGRGVHIVSPAELDEEGGTATEATASTDGDASKLTKSWGDLLARDVKIVADECCGMIFLPNWFKSRGAKLEAYVGLLQKGFTFWLYHGPDELLEPLRASDVMAAIARNTETTS